MKRSLRLLIVLALLRAGAASGQASSTTRLWSPAPPSETTGGTVAFVGGSALVCSAWVPPLGITSATSLSLLVTGGLGGGGLCSLTLYSADGSTKISTTGALDCSASVAVVATGLTPFTLIAGVKIQACICANVSGGSYRGAEAGTGGAIEALQNALATPLLTTAANPCVAAVAPATTGVLTATVGDAPFFLIGTNTP